MKSPGGHREEPTIRTEKARSEFFVAPVLAELKYSHPTTISLFSGVELVGDASLGLAGVCDFVISRSAEQLYVSAPVAVLVEAKSESLKDSLGQCLAEMLAARLFNEREGNVIDVIHGAVTTGVLWQFVRLHGKVITLDLIEYPISQPERVLGLLTRMVLPEQESTR